MVTRLFALTLWLVAGSAVELPDHPTIPPVEDFHCIADAKATMAQFGKAIADDEQDDMRLYSGSQATAILKTINDSPPETHYKGDALFVLMHHSAAAEQMGGAGGAVVIFLISDECITGSLPKMTMGSWASVVHESIGDDT